MKKIFWIASIGLILFECLNVYFIMPLPGSQDMKSLDLAYFLYNWRWLFRILFTGLILLAWFLTDWKYKLIPVIPLLLIGLSAYMANFNMAADHIFYKPNQLILKASNANKVDANRLVLGVEYKGQAKAYPIRFLGYHHQVLDSIADKPIMVTYCTVCRTGRVYEPLVNGQPESFRLVGMDHFNAMFEDIGTKSWWRQATGEAVSGPLTGQKLPEVMSTQTTLSEWLSLHPGSLIMQLDSNFIDDYSKDTDFETGKSRKKLTGTDSLSWNRKSWIIGVKAGQDSKAYDWNKLKKVRLIEDQIKETPILISLATDTASFFALERPHINAHFILSENELIFENHRFRLNGKGIDTLLNLKPLQAYQEFWHSWKIFNPKSLRDE